MKICFPVTSDEGLKSQVNGHFGSTKAFLIYDTDTSSFDIRENKDAGHQHGMCQPLKAIGGAVIDMVAVGGIGAGALMKLNAMGIKVMQAIPGSVQQNLDCYSNGLLKEIHPGEACAGHGNDNCGHN